MNIILTSAIIAAAALVGYVSYMVWGPDNKVEEACETVIQTQTGEKIDLSPEPAQNGPSGETQVENNELASHIK